MASSRVWILLTSAALSAGCYPRSLEPPSAVDAGERPDAGGSLDAGGHGDAGPPAPDGGEVVEPFECPALTAEDLIPDRGGVKDSCGCVAPSRCYDLGAGRTICREDLDELVGCRDCAPSDAGSCAPGWTCVGEVQGRDLGACFVQAPACGEGGVSVAEVSSTRDYDPANLRTLVIDLDGGSVSVRIRRALVDGGTSDTRTAARPLPPELACAWRRARAVGLGCAVPDGDTCSTHQTSYSLSTDLPDGGRVWTSWHRGAFYRWHPLVENAVKSLADREEELFPDAG